MYEKIAWNNFLRTGDIESYMEYKRLAEINGNLEQYNDYEINKIFNNILNDDIYTQKDVGESTSEFDKDKGDSDKRNCL